MQISLSHNDVVKAMNLYLKHIGIQTEGQYVDYIFKCKRKGEAGIQATAIILPVLDIPQVKETVVEPIQVSIQESIQFEEESPIDLVLEESVPIQTPPEPQPVVAATPSLFD